MDCRGDFFYVKETIALPYWSTQLKKRKSNEQRSFIDWLATKLAHLLTGG